jgi:hypothetical protein
VSSVFAESFLTYVAKSNPERIDVITITGTDQLVTAISRPNTEFSKTAVGIEITSPVTIALTVAVIQRRIFHARRIVK